MVNAYRILMIFATYEHCESAFRAPFRSRAAVVGLTKFLDSEIELELLSELIRIIRGY